MNIYFTITSLTFSYIIKILFLCRIRVSYLPSLYYYYYYYYYFFHKIPTQSSIKDKKMKDERGKRIVYIKIMYREPFLVLYTLGNIVATLEGWLNIGNLM
jgi:hypothetical protein